ncbi:hypothetical protein [Salinisphaera hydrothermalis]|uniref:hypothetical protein n=1 Tax=Salinisphaera hydrothermalis TaxID=563188 RepID=UPI00333F6BE7
MKRLNPSPGRLSAVVGILWLILSAELGGCALIGTHDADASNAARPPFAAGQESARDQLNDGYSDLYSNVKGLSKIDKFLLVKNESADVEKVVHDVTDYSGQLADRLQKLTHDFPALALDRPTTPPLIKAAHAAEKKALIKRYAPIVGDSGKTFERGLLIRLLVIVDQQRFLAQTLARRESDPALSKIMSGAATRFGALYNEIDALLKKRFYR